LVAEVVRAKALALVLKGAKVTDTAGAEVDLAALRPEGAEEIEELVREEMEKLSEAGGDPNEAMNEVAEAEAAEADPASPIIPAAPE